MDGRSTKLYLGFSLLLVLILVGIIALLLTNLVSRSPKLRSQQNVSHQSLPPGQDQIEKEPVKAEVNPTYTNKIEREPFWEMLPYYSLRFKIEYKDSADKIVITTMGEEPQKQKDAALRWLEANGATIESLTIEYKSL